MARSTLVILLAILVFLQGSLNSARASGCVKVRSHPGVLGVTLEFANHCGQRKRVDVCLREYGRHHRQSFILSENAGRGGLLDGNFLEFRFQNSHAAGIAFRYAVCDSRDRCRARCP